MIRLLALAGITALLAGCGGESHQDLRDWMRQQGEGMKGKIDPIPQVKPYEPFTYNAFDISDPFKPRKIEPSKGSAAGPDLTRRKEPLEAYPLENISMVGTLQQGKSIYAVVTTNDKSVFRVKVGNYLGQNFGVITAISEGEIRLKELIQDGTGDWTERTSTLQLSEPQEKAQETKK